MKLPHPQDNQVSLATALRSKRSARTNTDAPLTLADVAQLLWAAQGITDVNGYRTVPSAGALYPLEVFLIAGNVSDLPAGIYRYDPAVHALRRQGEGDKRQELRRAALDQLFVQDAAAIILIAAVYARTTAKYGTRGLRYVHMEAGHAAQNVALQAAALQLGTVAVGAFADEVVKEVVQLHAYEEPLYLLPIGKT